MQISRRFICILVAFLLISAQLYIPIISNKNISLILPHFRLYLILLCLLVQNIEDKVYKKTLIEKGGKDRLEVKRCLFNKCVSKKEGGGIYVGSSTTSEIIFLLSNTGFYQCKATAGDAFYSLTKESVISGSCIEKCEYNAFFAKSKTIVNIKQMTISNSKLDTSIDSNRIEISRINLTNNLNQFKVVSNLENSVISNSNFDRNSGSSSFISFDSSASRQSNLNGCNFIDNKYSFLVSFRTPSLTFDRCSFINDKTSKYSQEETNFVMNNCMYSEGQSEVNAKAMPKGLLNNPFFVTRSTIVNDLGSIVECWNKMSGGSSPSHSKSSTESSKVGKILGLTVLIGGIIACIVYFAIKYGQNYCKNSKRGDTMPLFYT